MVEAPKLSHRPPFMLAIAGGSGSGKTSLANEIKNNFCTGVVSVLSMDRYYYSQSLKASLHPALVNFDHPDSLDFGLLVQQLADLKRGIPIEAPHYDFQTQMRTKNTIAIMPTKVVIVEGILALYDKSLRDLLDISFFLEAPEELRLERRIERDYQARGRDSQTQPIQWRSSVQPMYLTYCEPTRKFAHSIPSISLQNATVEALEIMTTKLNLPANYFRSV